MAQLSVRDGAGAVRNLGAYQDANGDLAVGHVTLVGGAPVATGNPLPVSLPPLDATNVALGVPADAEAAGNGSIIGLLKRLRTLLSGILSVQIAPSGAGTMTGAVAVGTSTSQMLAARVGRRRLYFQNTGLGRVTIVYGAGPAVVGAGIVLDPASEAGGQGGSHEEPGHDCWPGAVQVIADAATTLTMIEG